MIDKDLNFRQIKIVFKKDNLILKDEYFDKVLKTQNLNLNEKWFLRGCKHITERHYTEAIKYFQLSNHIDSKFMALVCSFKVADKFLFDEYRETINSMDKTQFGKLFNRYGIEPYLLVKNESYPLSLDSINFLKVLL